MRKDLLLLDVGPGPKKTRPVSNQDSKVSAVSANLVIKKMKWITTQYWIKCERLNVECSKRQMISSLLLAN